MKSFKHFVTEGKYEDIVCKCHNITRGKLLEQAKFIQGQPKEDILKSLLGKGGCGCCIKPKGTCNKIDVHYTDVLS